MGMFYNVKNSIRQCYRENWMNMFMDMSKATAYAEKMERTCDVRPTYVSARKYRRLARRRRRNMLHNKSRLTFDESKMTLVEKANNEGAQNLQTPQESTQTEERKLVAY